LARQRVESPSEHDGVLEEEDFHLFELAASLGSVLLQDEMAGCQAFGYNNLSI